MEAVTENKVKEFCQECKKLITMTYGHREIYVLAETEYILNTLYQLIHKKIIMLFDRDTLWKKILLRYFFVYYSVLFCN